MNIDDRIKHLKLNEIQELIKRYYNNERVTELLEEYSIDCNPSQLYKLFPPKEIEEIKCPNCNVPMVINYSSKSNPPNDLIYCLKCKHKYNEECSCEICQKQKRNIIKRDYNYNIEKFNIEDISFKNRVYIASLLRRSEVIDCDNNKIILPFKGSDKKLSPNESMDSEIISTLFKSRIIMVDSESDLSAFSGSLIEENYGNKFYLYHVRYILNVNYEVELVNPDIDTDNIDIDEIIELWRKIALEECLEYLDYQMTRVKFTFNPAEKTTEVFNDLLNKFSVAQVFSIIYNSITNATRYYQEQNISKKQAANSVITRCQGYGERVLANGWTLKPFSRPYDCEQSIISKLFFNRIYPIGDDGLNTIVR